MERDTAPPLPNTPVQILLWISFQPCWGFSGPGSSSFPPDSVPPGRSCGRFFSCPKKSLSQSPIKSSESGTQNSHFRAGQGGCEGQNPAGGTGRVRGTPNPIPTTQPGVDPKPLVFPPKVTYRGGDRAGPGRGRGDGLRAAAPTPSGLRGGNFPSAFGAKNETSDAGNEKGESGGSEVNSKKPRGGRWRPRGARGGRGVAPVGASVSPHTSFQLISALFWG